MQRVLSFTLDKKQYVSKPFDFEAFCIVDENRNSEDIKGIYKCTQPAVSHMFEGTEATEDILKQVDISASANMCQNVWSWYVEALKEAGKNE